MNISKFFTDLKPFTLTYVSVIAFSNFVFVLFSQTIRDILWSFFKDAGDAIILGLVFLFAFAWLLKARPHNIPKKYHITPFYVMVMKHKLMGCELNLGTMMLHGAL